MAIYRNIHISFWSDPFIIELTPEEKYFYLYLMTNSKTTQIGIYELPKSIIQFETGYNLETVSKLLKKFIDYGKIKYDSRTKEVMILNWVKYNYSISPKVLTCIQKEVRNVKSKQLKCLFDTVCIQYGYSIDTNPQEEKEQEEKEEQIKDTKYFEDIYSPYKDILSFKSWRSWVDYRREKKKKLTESTVKAQLKKLQDYHIKGYKPELIISNSIENGWIGLFEPTNNNNGNPILSNNIPAAHRMEL